MARPKKENEQQIFYVASSDVLEPEMEIFPELTAENAIDYLRENEPTVKEFYLYQIKVLGKYKVKYTLEEVNN